MTQKLNDMRNNYLRETSAIINRLEELAEDDARARDGRGRNISPADVAKERADLLRRFEAMDSQALQETTTWLNEVRQSVEAARMKPIGDDSARMADLLQADQLARTHAADDLVMKAREHLAASDHRTAMVHLNAARLAANGKRVPGMQQTAVQLDEALDKFVPARSEAIATYNESRLAYGDATLERIQTRMLVAGLTGDRRAAAQASANAKLRRFDQAKAKGEAFTDEVKLAPVGSDRQIDVSYGGEG